MYRYTQHRAKFHHFEYIYIYINKILYKLMKPSKSLLVALASEPREGSDIKYYKSDNINRYMQA